MPIIKFHFEDVICKGPLCLDKISSIVRSRGISSYWIFNTKRKQLTRKELETYDGDIVIEPIGYFDMKK